MRRRVEDNIIFVLIVIIAITGAIIVYTIVRDMLGM